MLKDDAVEASVHVSFGQLDLEPHVDNAIRFACSAALARSVSPLDMRITAADLLNGVRSVVALEGESLSGTSAFRAFDDLMPEKHPTEGVGVVESEVSHGLLFYEPAVAASLTMAVEHLIEGGRSRFWGRDLVTSAVLSDSGSLNEFARDAGAELAQLRSRWFEVLQDDPNSNRADWPAWWFDRGLDPYSASSRLLMIDPSDHPLEAGIAPGWASGWGEDAVGPCVFVDLEATRLCLRWIPPGRFLMGSPEDEPGRFDQEGPQVDVTFRSGFWLMDAPVTQALWEEVMGSNPSQFVDPERPVEQVSFEDAEAFLGEINARVPGLDLRLPSEAEWEYACRAGTETAIWTGPLKILGPNNAPALDAIAWYGGNSGVGFDLENGVDVSFFNEKQYDFERAGTRKVRQKEANPWGCHDMLGNVLEWCADAWAESHEGGDPDGAPRQASQQEKDSGRVIRGGSWGGEARSVRAAFRVWLDPGDRSGDLGFRCARGQASSSRPGPGSGRKAELRPAPGHVTVPEGR